MDALALQFIVHATLTRLRRRFSARTGAPPTPVRQNGRFSELQPSRVFTPETGVLAVRNTGFANQSSIYSRPMSKSNPVRGFERLKSPFSLMWAGGDFFGPLSANVGPFSMNAGRSVPLFSINVVPKVRMFSGPSDYVFRSLQLRIAFILDSPAEDGNQTAAPNSG